MGRAGDVIAGVKGRFGGMSRHTLADDAMAGVVVGVEGVPDSLASGVLAGVNPVAATYGYIYGMAFGALFTGTAMMGLQTTGASAIVIADVGLKDFKDPNKALFTLAVLTGLVMLVAGIFKAGRMLRFVSRAVMTGFVAAVGINIVLGQLPDFTGYKAEGSGRIVRTFNLIVHFYDIHLPTLVVGVVTILLIVWLKRTALGAMGLVVAVVVASILAAIFQALGATVPIVADIAKVPSGLPWLTLPEVTYMPSLILSAVSLAFVGLMQGAAITTQYPVSKKKPNDPSADFIGEGVGCMAAGFFQGTPVSGSFGASQLAASGGAKTRLVFPIASGVMTIIILFLSSVISYVALSSLAGLLIYIGATMIDTGSLRASMQTGQIQLVAMWVTLVMTIAIPLQYSVLIGVGVTILMHTARQSSLLKLRQLEFHGDTINEIDPPATVGRDEVIVLQLYGSLYFATAATFEEALPKVTDETDNSVVQLRMRGIDEVGAMVGETFVRYISQLRAAGSKLVIVTNNRNFHRALEIEGVLDKLGRDNLVHSSSQLGKSSTATYQESCQWVKDNRERLSRDNHDSSSDDSAPHDSSSRDSSSDTSTNGRNGDVADNDRSNKGPNKEPRNEPEHESNDHG